MIAIVDACSGNLRSVVRALERAGGRPIVTRDPEVVRRADRLVVPGQGAFAMFMSGLAERGLASALGEFIASGRPYLGICLGLQVLFDSSTEHGETSGLGVVRGRVVRLTGGAHYKVPHIGWNRVHGRSDPLLAGIADDAHFYFVHSFHAQPTDRSVIALETDHGEPVVAAIRRDNLFACQFHPEKSQRVGLQLLANFVTAR